MRLRGDFAGAGRRAAAAGAGGGGAQPPYWAAVAAEAAMRSGSGGGGMRIPMDGRSAEDVRTILRAACDAAPLFPVRMGGGVLVREYIILVRRRRRGRRTRSRCWPRWSWWAAPGSPPTCARVPSRWESGCSWYVRDAGAGMGDCGIVSPHVPLCGRRLPVSIWASPRDGGGPAGDMRLSYGGRMGYVFVAWCANGGPMWSSSLRARQDVPLRSLRALGDRLLACRRSGEAGLRDLSPHRCGRPIGHMHVPMRARWRNAYPHARRFFLFVRSLALAALAFERAGSAEPAAGLLEELWVVVCTADASSFGLSEPQLQVCARVAMRVPVSGIVHMRARGRVASVRSRVRFVRTLLHAHRILGVRMCGHVHIQLRAHADMHSRMRAPLDVCISVRAPICIRVCARHRTYAYPSARRYEFAYARAIGRMHIRPRADMHSRMRAPHWTCALPECCRICVPVCGCHWTHALCECRRAAQALDERTQQLVLQSMCRLPRLYRAASDMQRVRVCACTCVGGGVSATLRATAGSASPRTAVLCARGSVM